MTRSGQASHARTAHDGPMKRTRKLSLPLVVVLVAVVALVIGSLGTANAAALTTKAVRKIAAKVVAKKAPGLSVAHAATATKADSATKADTAKKADTATSANDASTLGGQSPQLYLDRIGFVSTNSVAVGADTGNTLVTVNITVPQGVSIVHAIGNATIPANVGELNGVWLRLDNTDCSSLSGADYARRSSAKGWTTLTTQLATPTTVGAHTVTLCGTNQTTGVFATGVALAVTTVPRGFSGGGSIQ